MKKIKIALVSILMTFGLFAGIGERGAYSDIFKSIDNGKVSLREANVPVETEKSMVLSAGHEERTGDIGQQRLQKHDSIIVDTRSSLIWQDDIAAKNTKMVWKEAVKYCENLSLEGYDDWRLPSYDELLSIVDYDRSDPSIMSSFENTVPLYYWSSSQSVDDPDKAWHVSFRLGYTDRYNKSFEYYVRCIRG